MRAPARGLPVNYRLIHCFQILHQALKCCLIGIVVLPVAEVGDEVPAYLAGRVNADVGIEQFPFACIASNGTSVMGNINCLPSRFSRSRASAISVWTELLFMLRSERISSSLSRRRMASSIRWSSLRPPSFPPVRRGSARLSLAGRHGDARQTPGPWSSSR